MTFQQAQKNLAKVLSTLYGVREAENIAKLVFEDVFDIRHHLSEDELSESELTKLESIKNRLLKHEPVQYVIGEADFYGLRFKVGPAVLIPRPETEELVHWLVNDISRQTHLGNGKSLLDIGTGSGCIALTLKRRLPDLQVSAMDVSKMALEMARQNAEGLRAEVEFIHADILNKAGWGTYPKWDYIVSNPPYVLEKDKAKMAKNVLEHEPNTALFVDNHEPLLFYNAIAEFAKAHLNPGGQLFFETHNKYCGDVVNMLKSTGFTQVEKRKDISGNERMVRGIKP